jgi:hypothetical protein
MFYQVQCDCDGEPILVDGRQEAYAAAAERAAELGCGCHVVDSDGSAVARVTSPAAPAEATPPTSYAIIAAIDGVPGAWERVAWHTVLRATPIALGLAIVGVRGWRLLFGSALGSTLVTASLLAYYSARRMVAEQNGSGH